MEHKSPSEIIEESYERGHAYGTLTEAALALFKAYGRADLGNQRRIIAALIERTGEVAAITHRWDEQSVINMTAALNRSALNLADKLGG